MSLAAVLGLHAYLGSHSRFIADDFCSAGMARRFGLPRAVWYWYLNWTGRYSASALDAASGLAGPALTPYLPGLALLAWGAAVTLAVATLLPPTVRSRLSLGALLAGTVMFLTLSLSPNVAQALYWGQGVRSIVPPLLLSYLLLAHLVHVGRYPGSGRPWMHMSIAFVIALLIGGFNETIAALQLGMLITSLVVVSRSLIGDSRAAVLRGLIAATGGAALAVVVVAASPGNAIRQGFYPTSPSLPATLQIAWTQFAHFLLAAWDGPAKILATFGGVGLGAFVGTRLDSLKTPSYLTAVVLALGIGLAFAAFLPAAYALSGAPPERTLLIPSHVIVLSIVIASILLGVELERRLSGGLQRSIAQSMIITAAAAMMVYSATVTGVGLLRSLPDYREYAQHWDTLDAEIILAQQRGQAEVWIQPMRNWAGLNEPNDNPKFWVNDCMSRYYGISVLGFDVQ